MKQWNKIISLTLALVMVVSLMPMPALAADGVSEQPIEKAVIGENNELLIPFDQAYPEAFEAEVAPYEKDTILIKLKSPMGDAVPADLASAGVVALEYLFTAGDDPCYTAYIDTPRDIHAVMDAVRGCKDVLLAEYNFIAQTSVSESYYDAGTSLDHWHDGGQKDHLDKQWHLRGDHLQHSWDHLQGDDRDEAFSGGSPSVVVAVIDTGVDYDHEDLLQNMWVNADEIPNNGIDDDNNGYIDDYYGVDVTDKHGNGDDDNGHGTHVAGLIAAAHNKTGILGVAYNTKIMAIKAGQASGYFNNADIIAAVEYAVANGADVINMSFGSNAITTFLQDALAQAYTGSILVAAAGNDSVPNEGYPNWTGDVIPTYPAALSWVVGVMAVDQFGVETTFTNWDAKANNSVEYEVYAPGFQMVSTIPGDRYATWSGTSMAAPIVSGIAALLRTKYTDTETYPTSFIYGQLCATSDWQAQCLDPEFHGIHNLPPIVNAYKALTDLPEPAVNMYDYRIFDTVGLGDNPNNNGDGVIDAGETVALGFTLINEWGESADTVVSIDTKSQADIDNPYVTIENNDINYGSVGSGIYGTRDAGRLMDGDRWVGWETPFLLTIDEDCPNDTIITVNVDIACKNGLNDTDPAIYRSLPTSINLDIRRGTIIEGRITEDTTWTADHYYIIANATTVAEGATLTVEAGTQIQFWTDDPNDAYADTAIVYLRAEGDIRFEGTPEEHITIKPSERMDQYRVQIYETGGSITMEYTDVTNAYLYASDYSYHPSTGISYAKGCTFTQNYADELWLRKLNAGKIETLNYHTASTKINLAEQCKFYNLAGENADGPYLYGDYRNCLFADSHMNLSNGTYTGCVFYGNSNIDKGVYGQPSNIILQNIPFDAENILDIDYRPETGTTYVKIALVGATPTVMEQIADALGGHLACLETQNEYKFVNDNVFYDGIIHNNNQNYAFSGYRVGLMVSPDGSVAWAEPQERVRFEPEVLDPSFTGDYCRLYNETFDGVSTCGNSPDNAEAFLVEIPCSDIETITLNRYAVTVDTLNGYQLVAAVTPTGADPNTLVYTVADDAIAMVDDTGYILGVAPGETTVYVSTPDGYLTVPVAVTVQEAVELEDISLNTEDLYLNVGEQWYLEPQLLPADSSMTRLEFTSDDESVATVDDMGVITAQDAGRATITVTGINGVSATVAVRVGVPVEELSFDSQFYVMAPGEQQLPAVDIAPYDATETDLVWETSNRDIAFVDEDGILQCLQTGMATLRVTAESGVYADVVLSISDHASTAVAEEVHSFLDYTGGYYHFVRRSDGTVWTWNSRYFHTPKPLTVEGEPLTGVVDFAVSNHCDYFHALKEDGTIDTYSPAMTDASLTRTSHQLDDLTGAVKILPSNVGGRSIFVLQEDGAVWDYDSNDYGQLGVGDTNDHDDLVQMDTAAVGKVVDISACRPGTFLLNEAGQVWFTGTSSGRVTIPTFLRDGVLSLVEKSISSNHDEFLTLRTEDGVETYHFYHPVPDLYSSYPIPAAADSSFGDNHQAYFIEDGLVYAKGSDSSGNDYGQLGVGVTGYVDKFTLVPGITDAVAVFPLGSTTYVATADGSLYGMGYNGNYELADLTTTNSSLPRQALLGLETNEGGLTLKEPNVEEGGILTEDAVAIAFNDALYRSGSYSSITLKNAEGKSLSVQKQFKLHQFFIRPLTGFAPGEYTLTIPADSFVSATSQPNEEIVLTFAVGEGELTAVYPTAEPQRQFPELPVPPESSAPEVDSEITRPQWTAQRVVELIEEARPQGVLAQFTGNAILNRLHNDDVSLWLRPTGTEYSAHTEIDVQGNWWGTTDEFLIQKQILDYDDYQTLGDLIHEDALTKAPENVWPFVDSVTILDEDGRKTDTVGTETVTFRLTFNRDMDMASLVDVRFGSAYPFADYTISGDWVDERTWEGDYTLTSVIANGWMYLNINDAVALDGRTIPWDRGRFAFEVDTASALAMILQGEATETGISLNWEQDDYAPETLAGYNVYRSDGEFTEPRQLNTTLLTEKYYFDADVEPGKEYYYNFTVVKTDLTESDASGKLRISALDTMAPNIYHTPVYSAFTGSDLLISATVLDNVAVRKVTLHYRVTESDSWSKLTMNKYNDRFTASIPAALVTTQGLEYYIEAYDGLAYTYKGTAEQPFAVTVQQAVDSNQMGDLDDDRQITLKDALLVLRASCGLINLDPVSFARADVTGDGNVNAMDALRILQYVNGKITTLLPPQ